MEHLEGTSFANLLSSLRKRAHLTQQSLADRIGAHRSTISFWERGSYLPETLTTVLELAQVLHLSETDKRLLVEARFGTASILPLYNLPESNPYFTGRDTLLEELHRWLMAGEQVNLIQAQAISGLGGIGKTQLALAYAYRYRESYHDILWALAESAETLTAAYVTFAQQLRLDRCDEQEQSKVVEAVKRWLREHKGWLLILDNVEDLGLVRAFVPSPRQGTIVLTTRRAETRPVARSLTVDVFSRQDGILFLLRRAGLLAMDDSLEVALPTQREVAATIVDTLGSLPLALDQAGAYLAETRCTLSEYLTLLQQEQFALLHRRSSVPCEHPESVTTTFAIAFERVQQQNEAASDLLRLCAFLAPEAIPLDLFRQEGVEPGSVLTQALIPTLSFNAALETLQAYSLVHRDVEQHKISLHRLVQEVQREVLPASVRQMWAERAIRLVDVAFPTPAKVSNWERCQQLLLHALCCAESIEQHSFVFPEAARLLQATGQYLAYRGAYEQALELLRQTIKIREQMQDSDPSALVESLNVLAQLYLAQGWYYQAMPLLQRHLAIAEQAPLPDQLGVAECLTHLATLHWALGQYMQAVHLHQRALSIREQICGPDHLDLATNLNYLAASYRSLGHYEQALPFAQRALTILELSDPDQPDVAWSLNILANLLRAMGQYARALLLYQRAIVIREQVWGPDNRLVAQCLDDLAELYCEQGEYDQALSLAERALNTCKQVLRPEHPAIAQCLHTLAEIYCVQGQYAEALPLVQQAVAIREQALGSTHPDVALSLKLLAVLYQEQGRDTEAVPILERALTVLKHSVPDHPKTAAAQEQLRRLLQLKER